MTTGSGPAAHGIWKARRLLCNPIIHAGLDASIGENINGPSLIRVPEWVDKPLGRYYLYFAHHTGRHIRLAYADRLCGPWTIYRPGVLSVDEAFCEHHIASPDVHVDDERRQIRMYYHGPSPEEQRTHVAISHDGLTFRARPENLGPSYFRVWQWDGWHYAIAMPGILLRSRDGLTGFETGPRVFTHHLMRHSAVLLEGSTLWIFFSNIGDCPEHIVVSRMELSGDWTDWTPTPWESVLLPEEDYEGAGLPLEPSVMGKAPGPVRQLRDPAVFQEDGRTWLLYSVSGESGIAIAELIR